MKTAKARELKSSAEVRKFQEGQSAADALASVRFAALNEGVAMLPSHLAAALRKWIAEHDADLIELLIGSIPPFQDEDGEPWALTIADLRAEAARRRVGLG